jgi:hypothetical protein
MWLRSEFTLPRITATLVTGRRRRIRRKPLFWNSNRSPSPRNQPSYGQIEEMWHLRESNPGDAIAATFYLLLKSDNRTLRSGAPTGINSIVTAMNQKSIPIGSHPASFSDGRRFDSRQGVPNFIVLLSITMYVLVQYIKIGHSHFLQNPPVFIIHNHPSINAI